MLRHERPGELELRLHDFEPVLLEQDLGRGPVAERLALQHELRQSMAQQIAFER